MMSDSMGDFVLPKLIQTPLIFVAGGIGITPFHSMLSWLTATDESRPITMLYAVTNEDEIIFQDIFDKANVQPTIIVNYIIFAGDRRWANPMRPRNSVHMTCLRIQV